MELNESLKCVHRCLGGSCAHRFSKHETSCFLLHCTPELKYEVEYRKKVHGIGKYGEGLSHLRESGQ